MRELLGSWLASAQFHAPVLATIMSVIIFAAVLLICLEVATGLPNGGIR